LAAGTAAVATISVSLRLPSFTARGTALGVVCIGLRLEKLLLLSTESEGSPTLGTLDRLVLKTNWMLSFLLLVGRSSGHPIPEEI
jgi:hypothetical protein